MTLRSILTLALSAALACGVLAAPALAGDGGGLKLPGDPGLLYEWKERQRRGVTVAKDASLILRFDGCWNAETELTNTTDHDRTVSISVQFLDEDGRPLDAVPAVFREQVPAMSTTTVSRANCSAALAASYKLQRCWKVRRIVSAH